MWIQIIKKAKIPFSFVASSLQIPMLSVFLTFVNIIKKRIFTQMLKKIKNDKKLKNGDWHQKNQMINWPHKISNQSDDKFGREYALSITPKGQPQKTLRQKDRTLTKLWRAKGHRRRKSFRLIRQRRIGVRMWILILIRLFYILCTLRIHSNKVKLHYIYVGGNVLWI